MRPDQYERLQSLCERLTEAFLVEAEPANWPGAGVAPADMSKADRGDAYWCKKNAFATLSLIHRVSGLVVQTDSARGNSPGAVQEEEASLDAEVKAAEAEAKRLMDRLAGKGKAEFDKRVRGKA